MLFVAGNHDWGLMEERAGARRLRNLGEFLDRVRARIPDAAITTDIIVGFPGETESQFMQTYDMLERTRLSYRNSTLSDHIMGGTGGFLNYDVTAQLSDGDSAVAGLAHSPTTGSGCAHPIAPNPSVRSRRR